MNGQSREIVTLGTQDIKQRQANHKNKTHKNKKINNTVPTKN
jgi:hypothetical protein